MADSMTPDEFKQARQKLGLTQAELGRILNSADSTIRRWEAKPGTNMARPPNPVATRVLRWLLAGYRPPEWPDGK